MCIFCKIVNGEIPSFKIYENDDVVAFLDISQATPGHTLVIPKKHYDNFMAMDEEILCKIAKAVKEVANLLSKKLDVNDFNFVNNCGKIAGQSVMHAHFHVIPRYVGDEYKMNIVEHEPDFDALKTLQAKILK